MDSGRFLLAVVLMIAVMIVTNVLLPPPPTPATEDGITADSLGGAEPPVAAPLQPTQPDPDSMPVAAAQAPDSVGTGAAAGSAGAVPEDTLLVRSPLYEYVISNRGARLVDARLLNFESQAPERDGQPVALSSASLPGLFSYRIRLGTREVAIAELPFAMSDQGQLELAEGSPARTVELSHAGDLASIDVAYTFDPSRYLIDVRMRVAAVDGQTPVLLIQMPRTLARNEARQDEDERSLGYVVNHERQGIASVRLGSVDADRIAEGPLYWVAVKNKYFVAAAVGAPDSESRFGGLVARPLADEHAADMTATLLPGSDGVFSFRLYVGPQEPARLAEVGYAFDDVNPFGWRAFRPILRPLGHAIQWALFGMQETLQIGYGWVLVLFGVLIRLLMWPLNAKAMRSQLKNMEIQPKLKEIQAKYKSEPEKLQKEMLRLYKEEGFNPMGGCLPMLVPMPILITLFFVFQSTIAFRGVEFLWLPDLSQADPLYILPVLLGVSMFLMQWLSGRSMTEINPQMKFMMYAMPIFMTVLFLNFASGLNLYYAAMNFASIPQQFQIMRERKRFQDKRAAAPA